jgi:hypothetical protein
MWFRASDAAVANDDIYMTRKKLQPTLIGLGCGAATVGQPHPPFLLLRATVFEKEGWRVPLDKGEGGVKDKSFLAVAMLDTNISSSPSFPIMAIPAQALWCGGPRFGERRASTATRRNSNGVPEN